MKRRKSEEEDELAEEEEENVKSRHVPTIYWNNAYVGSLRVYHTDLFTRWQAILLLPSFHLVSIMFIESLAILFRMDVYSEFPLKCKFCHKNSSKCSTGLVESCVIVHEN